MLQDLARAFAQLGDPRARTVLLLGVGLSLLTLGGLVLGVDALLGWAAATGYGWLDRVLEVLGVLGTLVVAWFLFPVFVVALSSLFLERIVELTEERLFPGLPPPRQVSVIETASAALRLLWASLLLNALALPLYFVPFLNLPAWLLLNGYLIGREYGELVALRRVDAAAVAALRRRQRWLLWRSGVVIALLLALPVVNLVAPVVGASFMTQRLHRRLGPAPAHLKVRP